MSNNSSSLINNLRRFRFQKGPDIDELTNHNTSNEHEISNRTNTSRAPEGDIINIESEDEDIKPIVKNKHLQIQTISDSDEEIICNGNNTKIIWLPQNNNVHEISDSDDESPVIVNQKKKVGCIEVSDDEEDDTFNPEIDKSVMKTPSKTNSFNHCKSSDVICIDDESESETITDEKAEEQINGKRKGRSPAKKKSKVKKKRCLYSESSRYEEDVFNSDDSSDEISNVKTPSQKKVLDYLSNGSEIELQMVTTQKRVQEIMELRPFKDWLDLEKKVSQSKCLTSDIYSAILQIINARDVVSNLMKKCETIAKNLEREIADGSKKIKHQPSLLNDELMLKDYQMDGLNWLAVMNNQGLSGILADEMGLGKTVQVIAFLAYLKENNLHCKTKPHLIIVPASTLENWFNELEKWCPMLSVAQYYGTPEERKYLRYIWVNSKFKDIEVILTTYNLITSSNEEKKMFRVVDFNYVIFDEAHYLKNMKNQRYENLYRIVATHRILLTGTPLQNNLLELMSLLVILMPDMFSEKTEYLKRVFSKNSKLPIEEAPLFEQEQVQRAKRIMKPFILRRLKSEVLSKLPQKTSTLVYCELEENQALKYTEMFSDFKEGKDQHFNYGFYMMQLRRMANHPLACRYIYEDEQVKKFAQLLANDFSYKEKDASKIFEDLIFKSDHELHTMCNSYKSLQGYQLPDSVLVKSGKMRKLDALLPKLKNDGHRILLFSQFVFMLDILEDYMNIRGYKFLRLDGQTSVCERQDLIDTFNTDSSILVFLLSTKAGGLGINLTAADTVIIHDIDYNPYNDKQAEDRCHRMGQTRPVTVMRFIGKGTVEEAILKVAEGKLHLEKQLTSNKESEEANSKTILQLLRNSLAEQQSS
uniref:SWI/SNF-related matrix-associated actin-dependent regulator of chromatin subfamily A containing DEAD/H box 1 homolog n=2 Tax=Clastoptera arizonana TaxID=38151 RepID=A0A1B6BYB9_9HEMI